MGVKDIMNTYFFKVRFYYSDDIKNYVVSAKSGDVAEMLLLDDLYRRYLQYAKCDIELIGVCGTFYSTVNGGSVELEEGDIVEL